MKGKKNVKVKFDDFAMYHVDFDYTRHLHEDVDSNVYYRDIKTYKGRPYLGIIVGIDSYNYFIPLTSAKEKQLKWRRDGYNIFFVSEVVDKESLSPDDIVIRRLEDGGETEILLAVLDLKKMIPVPEGLYSKVDIDEINNPSYQGLVRKEFEFCKRIQDKILKQVKAVYLDQKNRSVPSWQYCNFSALEEACDRYTIKGSKK